jgi:hypothetical protein
MTAATSHLHAALIWGGEPIADVVLDKPGSITIGPVAGATFTVPDLGLPEVFPIVSHGERGYLLTMGNAMGGTVSLAGVRKQVTELVGAAPFAATPMSAGDWGVVELDRVQGLQLFFQIDRAATEAVPTKSRLDLETVLPAAAFSVVLHLVLLLATFGFDTRQSPFTWPGPRALTGSYLVHRIEAPPPPPPTKVAMVAAAAAPAGDAERPTPATQIAPPKKSAVKSTGRDGRRDRTPPSAFEVGLNSPEAREMLKRATNSPNDISKWTRDPGRGRVQIGDGDGGGDELPAGRPDGKDGGTGWKRQGDLDTDPTTNKRDGKGDGDGDGDGDKGRGRVSEVVLPPPDQVTFDPGTELDGREVRRRIEQRRNVFRTCYQRELNHDPDLAGKLTTRFVIAPDGSVKSVALEANTLRNSEVESCVKRTMMSIEFPTSDTGGIVRYPFGFQGGS